MARRLQELDWASTSVGLPLDWDSSLKTLVPVMLASNQPMFVVWGPDRTLIYNDAYAEILGNKHPAAIGKDFLEVWEEIREDLNPIVAAAYEGQPSQSDDIELWMQRHGYREETHFSYFYAPVRDESGQVGGFFCACNETTRQILAERRLAEREARYRGVLENMGEGFTLFDRQFTILEVNEVALRMVGLTREELIGTNHWERFPNTHDSSVGRMYRRAFTNQRPEALEHLYTFADGRKSWFHVRAFPVGDGLAVLFRDVTEQRRLQEASAISLERVQLALDAGAIMGTWVWDIQQDLVYGDERFAASFGLDPEELRRGTPIHRAFDAIHPDDRASVQDAVRRSVSERGSYRCQYRVLRDGAYRWVEAIGRVQVDEQGEPIRFPGVLLDIEERRNVEAERDRMVHALRQSDRRKDEFLAMLAHELRNPLAPIKTATQVLHLAGTDAALIGQSSQIIGRQVEHLTRLVDDLLDVSRVTRGLVELDRQSLDLSSVVATAVEQAMPLMQSRGHELRMRHGAGPIYVEGDFHRLVQVVVNLLNNAAKYTPQGGTIEVVLERVGERAVLRVADNGVGIAPHMLEEVFDLFTQAERTPDRTQGGLGVGLALVRSLVNLHRGQVTAHSGGLHKGSTFQVELPISSEAATVAVERKLTPANAAGRRVLVVDDNRDAADSLAALLELNGHRVETVYSGRSAVDRVTADPDWEVFLLDIGLPDMTGYELASALRAVSRHADAQFVALTGYGQPHDVVLSKASGFGHHLVKPADMDKLLSILSAPAKGP